MFQGNGPAKGADGVPGLGQFFVSFFAFHGKECAANAYKGQTKFAQLRKSRYGAGGDGVKTFPENRIVRQLLGSASASPEVVKRKKICATFDE